MTATLLIHQVCHNHTGREAVGRCQECNDFYCRECLAEHEGRLLCAACLARLSRALAATPRAGWGRLRAGLGTVLGFLVAWLCFYTLGHLLLTLPSTFHADGLWQRATKTFQRDE